MVWASWGFSGTLWGLSWAWANPLVALGGVFHAVLGEGVLLFNSCPKCRGFAIDPRYWLWVAKEKNRHVAGCAPHDLFTVGKQGIVAAIEKLNHMVEGRLLRSTLPTGAAKTAARAEIAGEGVFLTGRTKG